MTRNGVKRENNWRSISKWITLNFELVHPLTHFNFSILSWNHSSEVNECFCFSRCSFETVHSQTNRQTDGFVLANRHSVISSASNSEPQWVVGGFIKWNGGIPININWNGIKTSLQLEMCAWIFIDCVVGPNDNISITERFETVSLNERWQTHSKSNQNI